MNVGADPTLGLIVGACVGVFFGLVFGGVRGKWLDAIFRPDEPDRLGGATRHHH